ncbi:MAG: hypothetical protein FD123_3046 [Bacteroidetes bacterium]|nr:MAG: hypothetical protein FD123_3046 [Bacteroidota bacterium]
MKKALYILGIFLVIFLSLEGCKSYKQVTLKTDEFFADEELPKDINYYDLYVHHGTTSFRVKDPKIEGKTLKGKLEKADPATASANPKGRKELEEHKKDIHVWVNNLPESSKENAVTGTDSQLSLDASDIEKVAMYGDDDDNTAKIVIWAIVGLILGALIITGMIFLLAKGSDNASDNSSGGGGSNSNSGTGGSGSGCYVATMVYGSYEAPEVLVLRDFRDRFLARFAAGRSFIRWYYRHSPGFVERYRHSKAVNSTSRFWLTIFVRILTWTGFKNKK